MLLYSGHHDMEHLWVVNSSEEAVRWVKLDSLPKRVSGRDQVEHRTQLASLPAGESREASIAGLTASMVSALTEAGLTPDESAAMVATWDKQWYEEPGQRVFSILPEPVVDALLPLKITPKPHRGDRS